jgi:RNA polymerase sigma-70 factor (ECF subfamily)
VREKTETNSAIVDFTIPKEPASLGIRPALELLVLTLPPKERACVLLKDVFDYSLEETAELVNSTVGGVKAALNRARAKLASSPAAQNSPRNIKADPEQTRVMQLYVDRFNRRDWDGLRELISADASLRVADAFAGRLADSPYFGNYDRWSMPWKMALGEVDSERAVIILRRGADTWTPYGIVRLILNGPQIARIVDYAHCPWVISTATSVTLSAAAP